MGKHRTAGFLMLAMVFCVAAPTADAREAKTPPKPEQKNPLLSGPPLVFYVAKGEPGSCGRNCSEWIAAEGRFAPGSSQRFRELLNRLGGRALPVFFQSPGGLQSEALTIGRIMRSRGMTAGVAKTLPRDCNTGDAKACSALKQNGRVLSSDFRSLDASCNSACVYALAGAKTRRVPPGAKLGVHTSKTVKIYRDGRISGVGVTPEGKAVLNKQERDYLRAMGIADGLYQFAAGIPHEKVGYLSRDQVARFGIDQEPFQESNWISLPKPPSLLKLIAETRRANEIRMSAIRLACGTRGDRLQVGYIRGLASDETFGPPFIKLIAPGHSIAFLHLGAVAQIDSLDAGGSFETRAISASFEAFEAAAAAGSLEIVESGYKSHPPPRIVKFSTDGLSQALMELRKRCTDAAQAS
jgi:hypothetical protein